MWLPRPIRAASEACARLLLRRRHGRTYSLPFASGVALERAMLRALATALLLAAHRLLVERRDKLRHLPNHPGGAAPFG